MQVYTLFFDCRDLGIPIRSRLVTLLDFEGQELVDMLNVEVPPGYRVAIAGGVRALVSVRTHDYRATDRTPLLASLLQPFRPSILLSLALCGGFPPLAEFDCISFPSLSRLLMVSMGLKARRTQAMGFRLKRSCRPRRSSRSGKCSAVRFKLLKRLLLRLRLSQAAVMMLLCL